MLLLFVDGVMNPFWIIGIALFALVEKIPRSGERVGYLAGAALIACGGWDVFGGCDLRLRRAAGG